MAEIVALKKPCSKWKNVTTPTSTIITMAKMDIRWSSKTCPETRAFQPVRVVFPSGRTLGRQTPQHGSRRLGRGRRARPRGRGTSPRGGLARVRRPLVGSPEHPQHFLHAGVAAF